MTAGIDRSPALRRPVHQLEERARQAMTLLIALAVPLSVMAALRIWDELASVGGAWRLLEAVLGAVVLETLVVLLAFGVLICLGEVLDDLRSRSWDRALRSLR